MAAGGALAQVQRERGYGSSGDMVRDGRAVLLYKHVEQPILVTHQDSLKQQAGMAEISRYSGAVDEWMCQNSTTISGNLCDVLEGQGSAAEGFTAGLWWW